MMIIVVDMEIHTMILVTIQAQEENVKQMGMVIQNTLKKQSNVKRFLMNIVIMSAFPNKYLKKNVITSKFPKLPKFPRKNATMLKYLSILEYLNKNATTIRYPKLPASLSKN